MAMTKQGYKVKQDRVHQEVIQLMTKPMSAKELANLRGTNSTSANTLLKVMQGKGLVKKHSKIKVGQHHTALWAVVEKKVITIKPHSVFTMNILAMAA